MTVVYGWNLWVCETCGRSELYRAGPPDFLDDYPVHPDFWAEDICNDCYFKAHPRREEDNAFIRSAWAAELSLATKAQSVLEQLVKRSMEMSAGTVIHIPDVKFRDGDD